LISDTASVSTGTAQPFAQPTSPRVRKPLWEWAALVVILLLSAFFNFYRIDQNGFSNTYYAATVRSMSLSWHNWFFASFDPGGFVTVDKPPLGFWIQVASVWIFGFHGIALILPQAIAGVLSVWVLYLVIEPVFGGSAALLGALALALAPMNVVSNRANTLESQVVLAVLVAALAATKALERGSLRWLLVGAVCIGLGFNIKMLEAYLVVPALAAAYFLAAPLPWRARALHLLAAGLLMALVSFAWVTAVDLTPAANRPYIGSSYHNSEMDLIFAYNGLQRLIGTPWTHAPEPGGPTGAPGPFRLMTSDLASQIAWLLPLAAISLIVLPRFPWRGMGRDGRPRRATPQQGMLILWGVWLITMTVFFSQALFINGYYLAMLSPAIAALAGIGLAALWSAGRWQRWLLLAGVVATIAEQNIILWQNQTWNPWLLPTIDALAGLALCALLAAALMRRGPERAARLTSRLALMMLAVTVGLAPLLWTGSSLHRDNEVGLPTAGPLMGNSGPEATPSADPRLIAYVQQRRAGAVFLVATVDTQTAVPIIFSTGAPVMALGGYTGYDPIFTPATLAAAVASNEVRFFYLPSSNLTPQQARQVYPHVPGAVTNYTNSLTQWVAQHCRAVPPDQWSATNGAQATEMNPMQLFDCSMLVSR
jgi:4-amino-4-deoxy-L-arabinose transferase-like glycosyltransferase